MNLIRNRSSAEVLWSASSFVKGFELRPVGVDHLSPKDRVDPPAASAFFSLSVRVEQQLALSGTTLRF